MSFLIFLPKIRCPQIAINKGKAIFDNFKIYNTFQKRMFPINGINMKFYFYKILEINLLLFLEDKVSPLASIFMIILKVKITYIHYLNFKNSGQPILGKDKGQLHTQNSQLITYRYTSAPFSTNCCA